MGKTSKKAWDEKFQEFIQLSCCGMNFFGGPEEAYHTVFVKVPGHKTRRRVSEFARHTANQYYHRIVTNQAFTLMVRSRAEVVGMPGGEGGDGLSLNFQVRYKFCKTLKAREKKK